MRWNCLQPAAPGVFNPGDADERRLRQDHYVAELEPSCRRFHSRGIRVILTGNDIPPWAANLHLPHGQADITSVVIRRGGPGDGRIPPVPRSSSPATSWSGRSGNLELWNEPATWPAGISRRSRQKAGGVRWRLPQDAEGASTPRQSVNRGAVVIAGATSRFGSNGTHDGQHVAAVVRRYLRAPRRGQVVQRLLAPPLHQARVGAVRPACRPTRPGSRSRSGTSRRSTFPGQAVLSHRVLLQHSAGADLSCVVVSEADQAARVPAGGVRAGGPATADQGDALVPDQDWERTRRDPGVGVYTGLWSPSGERRKPVVVRRAATRLTVDVRPASPARWSQFHREWGADHASEGPVPVSRRSGSGATSAALVGRGDPAAVTDARARDRRHPHRRPGVPGGLGRRLRERAVRRLPAL